VGEANPDKTSKSEADFAIRYVHNGVPRKVILIEDKRISHEASTAIWSGAAAQLLRYMLAAWDVNPSPPKDMYGIVTIGHYSRCFTLRESEDTLRDFNSGYFDY
jgi:hypothetical protein